MDFNAARNQPCEQILFEHCYGYPLSGEFIRIDYCYDIPRILHCHVNPANQRFIKGGYSKSVIDAVTAARTFSYAINHTDNAVFLDIFTFGVYGGVYLGPATYGQLSNFNLDCVTVGIHKLGDGTFNRHWQIARVRLSPMWVSLRRFILSLSKDKVTPPSPTSKRSQEATRL